MAIIPQISMQLWDEIESMGWKESIRIDWMIYPVRPM